MSATTEQFIEMIRLKIEKWRGVLVTCYVHHNFAIQPFCCFNNNFAMVSILEMVPFHIHYLFFIEFTKSYYIWIWFGTAKTWTSIFLINILLQLIRAILKVAHPLLLLTWSINETTTFAISKIFFNAMGLAICVTSYAWLMIRLLCQFCTIIQSHHHPVFMSIHGDVHHQHHAV